MDTTAAKPTCNPAPLGLMGFGMTTVLLNIHNAGFFPINDAILAMGVFYGGIAQIIAGIMEFRAGNTFGFTAFISYGFFWLALVGIILGNKFGLFPADAGVMAAFLGIWGVFTAILTVGTFKAPVALRVVFISLTVLFALLVAVKLTGNEALEHFTGFEGIFCGASAMYLGAAEVINEKFGRRVLPI
jgi:succinate-acetate transporter protein